LGGLGQLKLAALFTVALASHASAETAVDVARKWGLIGTWAVDCSAPASRESPRLSYVIAGDNKLVHRRDFGDTQDENPVRDAKASGDGMLNLRVVFPAFNQTREYGNIRLADGTMRTMYNHDDKQQYSIKDGIFTANGNPTPGLHKCK
jgi:hypothetical protein